MNGEDTASLSFRSSWRDGSELGSRREEELSGVLSVYRRALFEPAIGDHARRADVGGETAGQGSGGGARRAVSKGAEGFSSRKDIVVAASG